MNIDKLMQLNKNNLYIVGVSGGPDSLMLLHLLYKHGFDVVIAHVNYHKRNDSDLDQELVENYAKTYQYPFEVLNVTEYTNENFQKQARDIRYQFFIEIKNKYKAKAILTAHHLDDVLETIIMQKETNRTKSYLGIMFYSTYQDVAIYRPLLDVSKKEIVEYCHTNNIVYRIDSSNLENDYTRNKIRNTILPMYSYQDKIKLLREAYNHNQQIDKRNIYIEELYNKYCVDSSLYFIDIEKQDLHDVLYLFVKRNSQIPLQRISNEIISNCIKLIESPNPNGQINLPVNHLFIKRYDNVHIILNKDDIVYSYTFNSFKEFDCEYFNLTRNGHHREGVVIKEDDFPITIRNHRPGDSIQLVYGTKKVNRLFIDAKIPMEDRKIWPILLNQFGEIILITKIAKNKEYLMENPTLFVVK